MVDSMDNTKDAQRLTAQRIRSILQTVSSRLASLGDFKELVVDDSERIASFSRRVESMIDHSQVEHLLVPMVPDVTVLELHKVADTLRSESNQPSGLDSVVVVDCFEEMRIGDSGNIGILSSNELWSRLTRFVEYGQNVVDLDPDTVRAAREYVNIALTSGYATDAYTYRENYEDKSTTISVDAVKYLLDWAGNGIHDGSTRIAIIGERGSGKTWLLKRFQALQMARHAQGVWLNPPAIFVSLRDYASHMRQSLGIQRSLVYYICDKYRLLGIGASLATMESLISTGHVILLLDGLDELSKEITAREFESLAQNLWWGLPSGARCVLTSRATKFSSLEAMYDILSGGVSNREIDYLDGRRRVFYPDVRESEYRPRFFTAHLSSFTRTDIDKLAARVLRNANVMNTEGEHGSSDGIISWLSMAAKDSIVKQHWLDAIRDVCEIPACCRALLREATAGVRDIAYLFDSMVLGELIAFNVRGGRAVRESSYEEINGVSRLTRTIDLSVVRRIAVIQEIARFLLVQQSESFDMEILGVALSEESGEPFEQVMVDLQSQSVFEFTGSEEGFNLRFRKRTMLAYFVARGIFVDLENPTSRELGLKVLGRYPLKEYLDGLVLQFLEAFFESGVLVLDQEATADFPKEHLSRRISFGKDLVVESARSLLESVDPFSVWTKYLLPNLEELDVDCLQLKQIDQWSKVSSTFSRDSEVVVAGADVPNAYAIAFREVTNEDFGKFLDSQRVPELELTDPDIGRSRVRFVERADNHDHPLSWNAIHASESAMLAAAQKDLRYLTNAYHLFEWGENGRYSNKIAYHPVVWISFYVCALYCNWLTTVTMGEDQCCYEIGFDNGEKGHLPLLKMLKSRRGFRLPRKSEWMYAARANDSGDSPWDLLLRSNDGGDKFRGQLLRQRLTSISRGTHDTRKSWMNGFGISGMLGNVREWVHSADDKDVDDGFIMGGTSALGEWSLRYDYSGSSLPRINTNHDVGFRIARDIDSDFREG